MTTTHDPQHAFFCPLCNHTEYEPLLARTTATGVYRCRQCHFGFVDPHKYPTPIAAEESGGDVRMDGARA